MTENTATPAPPPEAPAPEAPLLEVSHLKVHYPGRSRLLGGVSEWIKAVDDVSFTIRRGTTVGLVGESGSGKTTIGRCIVKLAPLTTGAIRFKGTDIGLLSHRAFFPYRKKIQMIFQDPYNSLNPRMTVQSILEEPLRIHFPKMTAPQREERTISLLQQVGLDPDHRHRHPHAFSGGQRQRIGIARALAVEPELILCDEPVSALDVSVQAQIVNLLQDLQDSLGLTYLFIAHDLAVVEHISDEVIVMTGGKIVEQADAESIYTNPQHDYTRHLLDAVPRF